MTFIQIDVPEELWVKYKSLVDRNITLDESIIILIKKAVTNGEVIKDVSECKNSI